MDRQKAMDILSGRRKGTGVSVLRGVLHAASWPYAGAVRLRRWAYRRGVLPSRRAGAPVICVGNVTTGGTGKTPMVAWVVRHLRQAGRRPAILTRGYQASSAGGSDEARLLAELTDVPVVVDADRVAGAARAVAGGADVLVMDDGFQHRRLRRDLDIVLIDAVEPFGFGHCLPRGLLREPPSALRDASAVLLTHCDEVPPERLAELSEAIRRMAPEAALAQAVHEPTRLFDDAGAERPLDALEGRSALAFCGLGSPGHFFAALRKLGVDLPGRRALNDHATYTPALLAELAAEAGDVEADVLVTTQKDHVKLSGLPCPLPVWQLAVRMAVREGAGPLLWCIDRAAGIASPGGGG